MKTNNLNSAKDVAIYYSEYLKKEFAIKASNVEEGKFTLYIYAEPEPDFGPEENYNSADKCRICFELKSSDIDNFKEQLSQIKDQYLKLSENVEINNIQASLQNLNGSFKPSTVYFHYGESSYTANFTMSAYFRSMNTLYFAILTSGKLKAKEDDNLTVMGFYIPFLNIFQIEHFIMILDEASFNALNKK